LSGAKSVGLEPQCVRDRLLVLAERHHAAPGERRVESVVVAGQIARVVEVRLANADLDVEVARVVVAIGDQCTALGLEVDHALLDELVREVVRRLLLLPERGHLALGLVLQDVEDGGALVGSVSIRGLALGDVDLGRDRRQLELDLGGRLRLRVGLDGRSAIAGAAHEPGNRAERKDPSHMSETIARL
jgi:hypothetical protein